ncbi:hypothetical protein QE152_g13885 [Popillia japonica]|uniref:Uncharacterized protein n=1 Tax=Popillia japonica TaxID=7064 RepID=A0AAW1LCP3_POPJA
MSEDKSFQNLSKVIDEPWPSDMFAHTKVVHMSPANKSFQNLSKVIDEPWPSDMFAHTKVVHMSPANLISEGNVAILIDPRKVETNKTLENLSMRYPAVLDMVRRNEGQIDYLTSNEIPSCPGYGQKKRGTNRLPD